MESNKINKFFDEYSVNSNGTYLLSGNNNLSVDGTGIMPSVDSEKARLIKSVIERYISKDIIFHLDVGCGLGWLSKTLDEYDNFESYGLEGSNNLLTHFVHEKSKIVIADLSKEIK